MRRSEATVAPTIFASSATPVGLDRWYTLAAGGHFAERPVPQREQDRHSSMKTSYDSTDPGDDECQPDAKGSQRPAAIENVSD